MEEQEGRISPAKRALSPDPGIASKFVRGGTPNDKEAEKGEKRLEDLGTSDLVERLDGLGATEVIAFLSNKSVLYLLDLRSTEVYEAVLEALIRAAGVHEDRVDGLLRKRFRNHLCSSVGRDRVRYRAFTNISTPTTITPSTPKTTTKSNTTTTTIAKSSTDHQHHHHYQKQEQ